MRALSAGVLLLTFAAAGCDNDATSTRERGGHFELVQPPPSVALPGYPLYDSIKVRLVDRDGDPMPHTPVQWLAQNGSVSGEGETNSEGIAAADWTLGPLEGFQALRVATLQDSSVELETHATYFRAERVTSGYAGGCAVRSGDIWCWNVGGYDLPRHNVSRVRVGRHR